MQSSPSYPELAEKLRPTLGGPLTITHVEFDKDHTVAFDAPVTEILTSKLKEGKTKEDLDAAIAELAAHFASAEGIRQPQAHGAVLEAPGTFNTIIGWDTLEVRYLHWRIWRPRLTGCTFRRIPQLPTRRPLLHRLLSSSRSWRSKG